MMPGRYQLISGCALLTLISRSYFHYALTICLLIPALVSAYWLLFHTKAPPLNLSDYYSYQCLTRPLPSSAADKPEFQILTVASPHAAQIADKLCGREDFARYYSGVRIRWQRRDFLTLDKIQNTRFDLFFNRAHVVEGIAPNLDLYYRMFRDSPHYSLYWVSLNDQPQMTPEYFAGKTIGLLADPHSQSFHIEPLDSLKIAGIGLQPQQIIFYGDMLSLYNAFNAGDVDLMTTPKGLISNNFDESKARYQLISNDMSPGKWYLSNAVNPDVHCALQTALNIYYSEVFPDAEASHDCQ